MEEGIFELAAPRVMRGQFYLFWHAGYSGRTSPVGLKLQQDEKMRTNALKAVS